MTTSTAEKLAHARTEQHVIALYKVVKGALELAFAGVVVASVAFGWSSRLTNLALELRRHVSGAWSFELAELVVRAATPAGFLLTSVALGADGVLSMVEAWALRRGHWWGPWLVVVTTGSLLPFEIVALVRHLRWSRVVVLVVNLLIVILLARKVWLERSARRTPAH